MLDEDKQLLIEIIDAEISRWCDFTGFNADGKLAARIADRLESEFAIITYLNTP